MRELTRLRSRLVQKRDCISSKIADVDKLMADVKFKDRPDLVEFISTIDVNINTFSYNRHRLSLAILHALNYRRMGLTPKDIHEYLEKNGELYKRATIRSALKILRAKGLVERPEKIAKYHLSNRFRDKAWQ